METVIQRTARAGMALLLVLATGCVEDGDGLARCDEASHREDAANCACNGPCGAGLTCHDGACCDPIQHAFDTENCGCRGPVMQGQFCWAGSACSPLDHQGDPTNCGCHGACAQGDMCVSGQCVCSFSHHKANLDNCGCNGPCLANQEVCANGKCLCDPSKNLDNPDDCACKGACPITQVCTQGRCECPAGQVLCKGKCEAKEISACLCDATLHQNDAKNCGCLGPCGSDQLCVDGKCGCDPVYHSSDATNCGCSGSACAEGQVCQSGHCVCPTGLMWCAEVTQTPAQAGQCSLEACCAPDQHQSDSANCNCAGPCPPGVSCVFGSCDKCDPLKNLENSKNCGCAGACKADEICDNGQCICKPNLYPCFASVGPYVGKTVCNPSAAGSYCGDCLKPCAAGTSCELKPGMQLEKYATTGQAIFQCCPPGGCCKDVCGAESVCNEGECMCKPGFLPCMSGKAKLSCVAEVNAKSVCPDCQTVCPHGTCTPTSQGGHACCTQKPDGSTVCCSTQPDGTDVCCSSPAGGPNACL